MIRHLLTAATLAVAAVRATVATVRAIRQLRQTSRQLDSLIAELREDIDVTDLRADADRDIEERLDRRCPEPLIYEPALGRAVPMGAVERVNSPGGVA